MSQTLYLQQAHCCEHFSAPMHNQPLNEERFSNIQYEPPLTQLHAIPLGPIIGHQRDYISIFPFHYEDYSYCKES